ncbi:MAG: RluA family pseudouridine synthase [Candidatus Pelethousia sp.]|nr:RluA family pseudouridine synthase [Candidatus Pelethousia sp.]
MNAPFEPKGEYDGPEMEEPLQALADIAAERLDVFCARAFEITRSQAQRTIAQGNVWLNGREAKAGDRLRMGDEVSFLPPPVLELEAKPQNIPLSIIYEDGDIAVVDKPQGMVVHPAPGNPDGTLVNALLFHLEGLSGIGGAARPGIVHRIDKLTSGLLVVAKNDLAHNSLSEQLKTHSVRRIYLALVEGNFREDGGTVDAAIARSRTDRKRMALDPTGRWAVTHWRVLERYGGFTLVEARLETGRTHQIRVHMASLHHPVAGDTVYGASKPKLGLAGQALHAARLRLRHPRTGEDMTFAAPVPAYFRAALQHAGRANGEDIEDFLHKLWEE